MNSKFLNGSLINMFYPVTIPPIGLDPIHFLVETCDSHK